MARTAGSVNKPTQALRALLDKTYPGWNPVMHMAEIAQDPTADLTTKLNAAKEVAKYIYPQLKGIDLSQDSDKPFRMIVQWTSE